MRRGTLNRYFFGAFVKTFGSTLIAVFALAYLIDMIEISRRGRFDDIGFAMIAAISALRVPSFIEQAFPFVILFSAIFTLVTLNRRMELVVARAAGVSIWQILTPFLTASLVIGILATAAYNPLASLAQAYSADLETRLAGVSANEDEGPRWLRQSGNGVSSIIGARAISNGGTELGGITAFVLDEEGAVRERIDAGRASLIDGNWLIDSPRVTQVGYPPEDRSSMLLPTSLLPEYIEQRLADPDTISIWALWPKIEAARSLGYDSASFSMRFHALIAMPALFVAMTLVAATVAVRYSRLGQSAPTIVSGIAAGFVLYVVSFLAQALGSNAVVPPVTAAWFPVVAAGLFGTTILLHQEDG